MFKRTQIYLPKSHFFGTSCQNYHLIQEEVAESSNTNHSKMNLKWQLEQVRLEKKIQFHEYQNEHRDKISQTKISISHGLVLL